MISYFTRITTTTTFGLAMLAGCATNPPRAPQTAEASPAAATPVKAVDPWAKSVPAAPSTPVKTAESPEPTAATPAAAPADSEPAESTSASGQRTHKVAKGETLYAISVKYYGTGSKWPKIVDANPGLKPERMPVGKSIVIP